MPPDIIRRRKIKGRKFKILINGIPLEGVRDVEFDIDYVIPGNDYEDRFRHAKNVTPKKPKELPSGEA